MIVFTVCHNFVHLPSFAKSMVTRRSSVFLHTDQFIACGKSRDKAHELASQIWLAVINNLEENEHTFLLLKRLAQEGDVSSFTTCILATPHLAVFMKSRCNKSHAILTYGHNSHKLVPYRRCQPLYSMESHPQSIGNF